MLRRILSILLWPIRWLAFRHVVLQTRQVHTLLVDVHIKLYESRAQILEDLKCPDATRIFTSGATEANYLALYGLKNRAPTAFVTSQRDHESVRNAAKSLNVSPAAKVTLPLD